MEKMNLLAAGFICLGFALGGCATTTTAPKAERTVYTGFVTKANSVEYQDVMNLSCPASIETMTRSKTYVYSDDGLDVSCNYVGDGEFLTQYFSRYVGDELGAIFISARQAIESRFAEQGFVYDEELSEVCELKWIDEAALLEGFAGILSGENTTNNINLSRAPSAVYVGGDRMTFVIVDEPFEYEFFKIRYTGAYDGTESVDAACAVARQTYLTAMEGVREKRGIKSSDILSLLKASEKT